MCLGNTITYRCCGKQEINYTGAGQCDIQDPYPDTHVVHGWRSAAEICSECEEQQAREDRNASLRHTRMARRAKGVLEYFNGFRPHPIIRDDEDWFAPRRIDASEIEETEIGTHATSTVLFSDFVEGEETNVPIPLSFLDFVEMNRGTLTIGMFPGHEEESLQEDVDQYIEYLEGDDNLYTQHLNQFKHLLHDIRVSEQENFDFDPKAAGIPTFREYQHAYSNAANPTLFGEVVERAVWIARINDYRSMLANFVAPERMFVNWQASRDTLAINDRRELYEYHRQDHVSLGNGHGWFETPDFSNSILSFRDWIKVHTKVFTFDNYDPKPIDQILASDLGRYEQIHLGPYGTVDQIVRWKELKEMIWTRPLNWTPGPDAPTLVSFSEFCESHRQQYPERHWDAGYLMLIYRDEVRESASKEVLASFELAWGEHNERTRDMLYGWQGDGFPPLVTSLRTKRQLLWDIMHEVLSFPEALPLAIIPRPAIAILDQHIALWTPLSEAEEIETQRRIEDCTVLLRLLQSNSHQDDNASIIDECMDSEGLEVSEDSEDIISHRTEESVSVPPSSEFHQSIDQAGMLTWPESFELPEEIQVELFARLLDEEESEDEQPPLQRQRRTPPEHWFEEGGPLADVHRPGHF